MTLMLLSFALFIASGLASLLCAAAGKDRFSPPIGAWGAVFASAIGCIPALEALLGRSIAPVMSSWRIFMGSFCIKLDMLSAFFLLMILVITAFTAVYGLGYGKQHAPAKRQGTECFFFNLLGASMAMVCVAANALLFLLAWELMALSSFFLVARDHEKIATRKAAWVYITATYLGTACLLPMFLLMGSSAQTLDFGLFGAHMRPALANVCFLLALVGFGTKAGIMPFHVWLPDAHPAAPTHVSALMSGVMIKTGIYGFLRCMTFFGPPPLWWGALLIAVGALSAIVGVLFALAQHDLKRLLAYSSIENVGIAFMGLGIGCVGLYAHAPITALLGFSGALLHVVNHALFKGLLFMGAGAVYCRTGTREIDLLGGVMKKMPVTGAVFLVGAVAISGLPPLNGFFGEFLLYAGSFFGIVGQRAEIALPLALAIASLALIGGLAAACFTKAFGIVFLGSPRSAAHEAHGEVNWLMLAPMAAMAGLCVVIGLVGPLAAKAAAKTAMALFGKKTPMDFAPASGILNNVWIAVWALVALMGIIYYIRGRLLRKRSIRREPTWDCGYVFGTRRMQYTGSSLSQPIIDLFSGILNTKKRDRFPEGYFPVEARFSTETLDAGNERIYKPVFSRGTSLLARFGILQRGRIQTYVLNVVIALVVLLFWRLR